jgi:exopolyphosphatase/guanosine-5'-triphosphate,3'-diphosphate pyrophosphatase
MRVAVVDIGTNSTRLLVADVDEHGGVTEVERRSTVTRLGQGVEASGSLSEEAMDRVFATLDDYARDMERLAVEARPAVLTSAVRDAANGGAFTGRVVDAYGLEARVITGDEEAELTFLGATSERTGDDATIVVVDIGGGSTEFVVGDRAGVDFHVSTQAGVVRHGERHVTSDPPRSEECEALAQDVRAVFAAGVPESVRARTDTVVGVAGTATSCAAMDLGLDPYDPERVHGHRLSLDTLQALLARLAAMTDAERRGVTGLQPDRAPTIVPGVLMLIEALRLFGARELEVSEHDILRGVALRRAGAA